VLPLWSCSCLGLVSENRPTGFHVTRSHIQRLSSNIRGWGRSERRVVGVAGLEPATSWSRTMRASHLRYTPTDGSPHPQHGSGCEASCVMRRSHLYSSRLDRGFILVNRDIPHGRAGLWRAPRTCIGAADFRTEGRACRTQRQWAVGTRAGKPRRSRRIPSRHSI
jgi:hypothetical protein